MRTITVLFLVILLGSWVNAPAAAEDVRLILSFEKEEFKQDEPINAEFILKNTGKGPVYVNKRFQVGSKDFPKKDREIYMKVISPKGEEVPYKASPYEMGLPKSDYFVLLGPGEEASIDRKRNIKGYFDFKEPGEYKITATYENAYGAEIGLDAVKGKIESEPVVVKIIE